MSNCNLRTHSKISLILLLLLSSNVRSEIYLPFEDNGSKKAAAQSEKDINDVCLAFLNSTDILKCTQDYLLRKAIRANNYYERGMGRIYDDSSSQDGIRKSTDKYFNELLNLEVNKQKAGGVCKGDAACLAKLNLTVKNSAIIRLNAKKLALQKVATEIKNKMPQDSFKDPSSFDAEKFKKENPHLAGTLSHLCDGLKGKGSQQFDCYKKDTENFIKQLGLAVNDLSLAQSEAVKLSHAAVFCLKSSGPDNCTRPNGITKCSELSPFYAGDKKFKEEPLTKTKDEKCGKNYPSWKDVLTPYRVVKGEEIEKPIPFNWSSSGMNAYVPLKKEKNSGTSDQGDGPGAGTLGAGKGGGGSGAAGTGDDKKLGGSKPQGIAGGDINGYGKGTGSKEDQKCGKKNQKDCEGLGLDEWGVDSHAKLDCPITDDGFSCKDKKSYSEEYSQDSDFFVKEESFCQKEILEIIIASDSAHEAQIKEEYNANNLGGHVASALNKMKNPELEAAFRGSNKNQLSFKKKEKTNFTAEDSLACKYLVKAKPDSKKIAGYRAIERVLNKKDVPIRDVELADQFSGLGKVLAYEVSKDLGLYSFQMRAINLLALKAEQNPKAFDPEKEANSLTRSVLSCSDVDNTKKNNFKKALLVQGQKLKNEIDEKQKININGKKADRTEIIKQYHADLNQSMINAAKDFKTHADRIRDVMDRAESLSCRKANSKDHSIDIRNGLPQDKWRQWATDDLSKAATENMLGSVKNYYNNYKEFLQEKGFKSESEFMNFYSNNPCDGLSKIYAASTKGRNDVFSSNPLLGLPVLPNKAVKDENCSLGGAKVSEALYDALDSTVLGAKRYLAPIEGESCKRHRLILDDVNSAKGNIAQTKILDNARQRVIDEEIKFMSNRCDKLSDEGKRASAIPSLTQGFYSCQEDSLVCQDGAKYGWVLCELFRINKTEKQTHEAYETFAMTGILAAGVLTGGALSGVGAVAAGVIGTLGLAATAGSVYLNYQVHKNEVENSAGTKSDCVNKIGPGCSLDQYLAAYDATTDSAERRYIAMQALEFLAVIPDGAALVEGLRAFNKANRLRSLAKDAYILGKTEEAAKLIADAEKIEKDLLEAKALKNASKERKTVASGEDITKSLELKIKEFEQAGDLNKANELKIELNALTGKWEDELKDIFGLNKGYSNDIKKAELELYTAKAQKKSSDAIAAIEKKLTDLKFNAAKTLTKEDKSLIEALKSRPDDTASLLKLHSKYSEMTLKAARNPGLKKKIQKIWDDLNSKLRSAFKNGKCGPVK